MRGGAFVLNIVFAAALLLSPGRAAAQAIAGPPELARVSGLPANDTLAVRDRPAASAEKIGGLPDGAGPVEILQTRWTGQTEWARISWPAGDAWVARRYLEALDPPQVGDSDLRVGLICRGTEPFWTLALISPTVALWREPDLPDDMRVAIRETRIAEGRAGSPVSLALEGPAFDGRMSVAAARCSDGMSDRVYGWSALLETAAPGDEPRLFEGCCGFNLR